MHPSLLVKVGRDHTISLPDENGHLINVKLDRNSAQRMSRALAEFSGLEESKHFVGIRSMEVPAVTARSGPSKSKRMAEAIEGFIRRSFAATIPPIKARLDALERQAPDGSTAERIDAEVQRRVERIRADLEADARRSIADAVVEAVDRRVNEQMDAIAARAAKLVPPGRDGISIQGDPGRDGENGKDGFTPDDLSLAISGRMLAVKMKAGDRVVSRTIKFDGLPLYCGVHEFERQYEAGDVVTYAGSGWIALQRTKESPAGPDGHWKLMIKGSH